ncbi:hypothetical protein P153DRAFT_419595 [Dothidotthia symphoricarpi CBS 119687]|uniref:D-aminoacid aminotransferase-like PLP-dependent enzyme n=1 Tax=Dothidotthia symphoricarpi CBS 119687 TaxID=1392245 RepID=A0A6A6ARR2_9PLEO|nr:uncharacterized protein P153DRAFT_419595 [Dothidotthia symphoricarpi CBS 119687]KAF2133685.1 hypothetical protein P153DRAFT_419595 [Dothidotthia symphoricarpi CBS 119687]
MTSPDPTFQLFTSLRYDPLLLISAENSLPTLNFIAPSPFYMLAYHRDRMLEAAQHFDFFAVASRLSDGVRLHNELLAEVEKSGKTGPLKLRILFDTSAHMTVECASLPATPLTTLYPLSLNPPSPEPFTPSPLTGGALTLPQTTLPQPPQWTLRLDTHPTPSTPFTLLKTTHRPMYDSSRERALPAHPAGSMYREVMLYNECDELTEGALTSLYLFRGGRWVTPPVGVPSGEFTAQTLRGGGEGETGRNRDEGELRDSFAGRWGHSLRSAKVGAGGQRGTSRRWALGKGFCMEEPVGIDTVEVGEGVWVSNGVRGFGYGRVVAA